MSESVHAYLLLEDGTVFEGQSFGAVGETTGELVFTTNMTGYLEMICDPAFAGQIIVNTFPLLGNYGIISGDMDASRIKINGFISKYMCQEPSNFRNEGDLGTFFVQQGVVGLCGIDTRALIKLIRKHGSMKGKILTARPEGDTLTQAVLETTTYKPESQRAKAFSNECTVYGNGTHNIAMLDLGAHPSIIKQLTACDCTVHCFPHHAKIKDIMASNPAGIIISSGPGAPTEAVYTPAIKLIKTLCEENIPMMGIGLGHQLMALVHGFNIEQLTQAHRGSNIPVRETETGRVFITSQNHAYTVIAEDAAYVNVNDNSCEGLIYNDMHMSYQFNPGNNTAFLYDRFINLMHMSNRNITTTEGGQA